MEFVTVGITDISISVSFSVQDLGKNDKEAETICLGSTLQITREGLVWALKKRMDTEAISEHYNASIAMVNLRINSTGVKRQLSYLNI